ncbi:type VI secretion system Vgr family protein [Cupriavidus sp. AU9028]|uniref:type VI secretion system Vgr family protein n=1 Tax=Cupriavidus sp. AU9028 TaxID=2871157 RepID=UPI001C961F26|nr:type VI secretion system tip protein VgrG [Cupriavidus sp. AU9028]MBY4897511.1 type VI secretion system tip protein VgrG [Cupriavidus sp. AU9028]
MAHEWAQKGGQDVAQGLAALWRSTFVQHDRLLRLTTPLGADVLLAERMQARERLDGGGFRIELTALSDYAALDATALLGQPVRIDLLTQRSRTEPRPLHGHVTSFERLGANGGLARYRLVVEPWLAFLRYRRDSFLFQDLSVIQIVESVFANYSGQGRLVPAWRWSLADSSRYPKRSVTTQFDESDFDFVARLLAQEGLFYFFEHETADGDALGVHRMVIADRNEVFADNAQPVIRFGRADVTASEDVVTGWQSQRQWQTNAIEVASWDYRSASLRTASLATHHDNGQHAGLLLDTDYPGQYAFADAAHAERLAAVAMESLELRNKLFHGEGTVRTLAPGTVFELRDHFEHDADEAGQRRFAVMSVTHEARNNFDERFARALAAVLPAGLPAAMGSHAAAAGNGEEPLYRNRFDAFRVGVPYRPALRGEDGRLLHPRPTVRGGQTALVVGDGQPVHTDRDHRIKVQFHWQRGARSASRQSHPAGDDNAPARGSLGCWLRVAAPVAGDNWGAVALPRVGQEVIVEFVNGDIDRPVVVGAAYNGRGETDAQVNRQQAGAANATGNAPAWFAGDGEQDPAHAHDAVLSGIKTQALSASQSGDGGYNQLVFDDTPGQSRTLLCTTQAGSALALGHHLHQRDNARGAALGHGAALATDGSGSVRAGAGLLIAAEPGNVQQPLLQAATAVAQVEDSLALAHGLATQAAGQQAALPGDGDAASLPALKSLQNGLDVLRSKASGADGASVPAFSEPHLVVSGAAGVTVTTPADAVLVAGTDTTLVAGEDLNVATGRDLAVAVAQGLSLYTDGQGGDAVGIALHAARGDVEVASLAGASRHAAHGKVTVASTQANVAVEGKQHVLLNAAGAQIRMLAGKIELHAPGKVEFKGAGHRFVGPAGAAAGTALPSGDLGACEFKLRGAQSRGDALVPLD